MLAVSHGSAQSTCRRPRVLKRSLYFLVHVATAVAPRDSEKHVLPLCSRPLCSPDQVAAGGKQSVDYGKSSFRLTISPISLVVHRAGNLGHTLVASPANSKSIQISSTCSHCNDVDD